MPNGNIGHFYFIYSANFPYLSENSLNLIAEEAIRILFGIKLKYYRSKNKLSPTELSEKTGISISYLNEIEKGKKYPKTDKILILAEALQTDFNELVSTSLPKEYAAIELILKSDFLKDLPLDLMGLNFGHLIDVLTSSPTKINAFLNTIIEIARNHELNSEYFYFSVLRSYQELEENYFEEIELHVEHFLSLYADYFKKGITSDVLSNFLNQHYQYSFKTLPETFNNVRSIYKAKENTLYLNKDLNEHHLLFVLGREVAYNYLQLHPRNYVTTHFSKPDFAEILNNFLASYFATALLLPQKNVVQDLKQFFGNTTWSADGFSSLATKYGVSIEMFMHRLTNLLPAHFGLKSLFFIRLIKRNNQDYFIINKEIHLGRLHNPHATSKDLHYCRRWVSIRILQDFEKQQKHQSLVDAQISNYPHSKNAYFIISAARSMHPFGQNNTSVSIGISVDKNFSKQIAFANDASITVKDVGEACELCTIQNCKERVQKPFLAEAKEKEIKYKEDLELFLKSST